MAATDISKLHVGDIIRASVIINTKDWVPKKSKKGTKSNRTGTSRAIKNGEPVERSCVVLEKHKDSVTVTYLATFNSAMSLPDGLDNNFWYPVKPAPKEGTLEPLPALPNQVYQWASLRKKQVVNVVKTMSDIGTMSAESAGLILVAMKA